jgi:hypothetical protein
MAAVEELASVPLFSSLSDGQRSELAGWFEEKSAARRA